MFCPPERVQKWRGRITPGGALDPSAGCGDPPKPSENTLRHGESTRPPVERAGRPLRHSGRVLHPEGPPPSAPRSGTTDTPFL